MEKEPDAQTLKRPSARNCSWFHRHSVSWNCKHHYHCYRNYYINLQAANTQLKFGLSAQILEEELKYGFLFLFSKCFRTNIAFMYG